MPFQKLPDNLGMIYGPDCKTRKRKNPCQDRLSSQWCGNERCCLCRENGAWRGKKNPKSRTVQALKMSANGTYGAV